MSETKTSKDVLEMIEKENAEIVDLRFMDFPGLWQHFSVPVREIEESTFEEGLGFDGSSIRGWQAINESDMLVKPVPETAFIDPFFAAPHKQDGADGQGVAPSADRCYGPAD